MPSTDTTRLKLIKMATGEESNTWGTKLNTNFDQIDKAVAGKLSLSVAGSSDVTLTESQTLFGYHEYTGALTGDISVKMETDNEKILVVFNNTSGAQTLTVKTNTGTGILVPQGDKMLLVSDGTNMIEGITSMSAPRVTTIELGAATDTTLSRASAGDVDVEGNIIYRAGGTDVPVTDGGTGGSTVATAKTNLELDGYYAHNFIINGDFSVAQRGTSFTAATTPANDDDEYLLDRWLVLSDGDDIVDVTQGTDGSVGNGTYLQADVETAQKKFGFFTVLENKDTQILLPERGDLCSVFELDIGDLQQCSCRVIRRHVVGPDEHTDIVHP